MFVWRILNWIRRECGMSKTFSAEKIANFRLFPHQNRKFYWRKDKNSYIYMYFNSFTYVSDTIRKSTLWPIFVQKAQNGWFWDALIRFLLIENSISKFSNLYLHIPHRTFSLADVILSDRVLCYLPIPPYSLWQCPPCPHTHPLNVKDWRWTNHQHLEIKLRTSCLICKLVEKDVA